ncbi:TPA: DUF2070 family protein [Candidatus Bathyarchaeota archaeon]|nr:DUF2070 family protein [Candidatus Bathyarchaeota archaeon]
MMSTNKNSYRERAVSRYSSLFTLPSARKNYVLLSFQCILTGISIFMVYSPSLHGFFLGLMLGIMLFLVTCFCNYVTCRWLLRDDLILDFRRTSFLSLISNSILSILILVDFIIFRSYRTSSIELKATSIGVFCSLALRILVFQSISFVSLWRIGASTVLQPSLFLVTLFAPQFSPFEEYENILLKLGIATFVAFLFIQLLTRSLNQIGLRTVGIPSIKLFRAFLANWTEGFVEPLEEVFKRLSEERDIKVSMLAFRSKNGMKAMIVIPSLHPGPFKNVGSSCIPSMIQKALEEKFRCVVSVPHGISGHELDLASQSENMKVLNRILKVNFTDFKSQASSFLSLKKEDVTVNCQTFGEYAFVIITLSPNTMEDLPLELREIIAYEAKKQGFSSVLTVDAHNSISGYFDAEKIKKPVLNVVSSILEKAARAPRSKFEVGATKVVPSDFSIQNGMGPGGISIIVVNVNGQKTAYITIDGNNMVSGLREKILSEVKSLGIDNSEVMTTDTHAVNAVILNNLGYHPIGEAISHEKLIRYIKDGVKEALGNLEPVEASWHEVTVPKVKVIGERQIDNLCLIVDGVSEKTKKNSIILFSIFISLLLALLAFIL